MLPIVSNGNSLPDKIPSYHDIKFNVHKISEIPAYGK